MRHWAREAGTPIGRRRASRALRVACCVAGLWAAGAAHAQVSGSVGVVSDYRYRGHSLSDGEPAVQAAVGYDAASGAYGGLFGSTTRLGGDGGAQWIPYAGFARRDRQGRSWDVGVRYVDFTQGWDYAEAHAGVSFQRVTLRLHYAPDYYGITDNLYFETDFSYPIGARTRLLLHGGVARSGAQAPRPASYGGADHGGGDGPYRRHADPAPPYGDRTRFDLSAGVVVRTRVCDVQATWHSLDGSAGGTAAWMSDDRSGFVLGCTRRW